jgi:hypothetical protein
MFKCVQRAREKERREKIAIVIASVCVCARARLHTHTHTHTHAAYFIEVVSSLVHVVRNLINHDLLKLDLKHSQTVSY